MTPLPKSSAEWVPDLEAEDAFLAAVRAMNAAALAAAQAIDRMAASGHWKAMGCANLGAFAEMSGLSAGVAWYLRCLPEVLRAAPELEKDLVEGTYGFEAVASLAPFVQDPTLLLEGETLPSLLVHRTGKQIRRLVRQRRIARKDATRKNHVSVDVSDDGLDTLEHARELHSQKLQRPVSMDEVVEAAAQALVEKLDPLAKAPRRRRMADTDGKPGRGIAAEVVRWILLTYGRKCLLWWCDNDLLRAFAHRKSKKNLGGQEKRNLIPPCCGHHVLYDLGLLIEVAGGGKRYLANRWGRLMGEIIEPPAEVAPAGGGVTLFNREPELAMAG